MNWLALNNEQWLLYSQIGLRLVDEFTAKPLKYPVSTTLEYQDSVGEWHTVKRDPVVTPNGLISYPSLGRSDHTASQPVLRHRVLLHSDFYRPDYLLNSDGIEFDIYPYDDFSPPAVIPTHPQTVLMFPSTVYAYPNHLRLVKGLVQDSLGDPVANVEVSEGTRERILTDKRGAFTLPLRWPANNASVMLDALDHRSGRNDSININLPDDLYQGHTFTIT